MLDMTINQERKKSYSSAQLIWS